jgi:uncharacterized repeat protein (TIGR02059 family)
MTTTARGRHRKLRRSILHTVVATALLAGTFTVADQTVSSKLSAASANEAGKVDGTFTSTARAAQSIAAFSDSSFVVGYSSAPQVKRFTSSGTETTLTTVFADSAKALEVDRATNNFIVGGSLVSDHRSQMFSQTGTLVSAAGSNNFTPQGSSSVKFANNSVYLAGDAGSVWLGKFSSTLSADTTFNSNVNKANPARPIGSIWAVAVDANGLVYFGGVESPGATIKRTLANGLVDTSYSTSTNPGSVYALETDSTNSIVVGSATAPYLYRYGPTGTLDTAFASAVGSTFNGKINSIKIHNNMIYVGGDFAGGLKRLYLDGTPDAVFNANVAPSLTNTVKDIEIDPAGRVLVAYGAGVKRFVTADVSVPAAPTITSTLVKESSMQFNLTSSDVANTSRIVVSTVGLSPEKTCSITGTTGSCLITGLTNGTSYNFEAKSYNGGVASLATSSSGTPLDLPPVIQSASIDTTGKIVSLVFDQTLSTTTAQNTDFVLTLNGQAINSSSGISAIATSGATLNVTLVNAIQRNSTLTISYTPPINDSGLTNQAIQDTNGNDSQSFSNFTTTNNSTVADTLPPVLMGLAVNSSGKVVLTYNETLNTLEPNASAFTIKINGATQKSVTGFGMQSIVVDNSMLISGTTITLGFNWGVIVEAGDVVTIAYANVSNPATNNRAIQDNLGNDAAPFSETTITSNNSTVDLVRPTFTSAAVNTTGTKVILAYSEALNATTAGTGAFAVNSGGSTNTVTAVNIVGSTVELTLTSTVQKNQLVTVAYTAPTSNAANSNSAIQDTTGNDAVTLSATSVTNNSTIDTVAPVYTSAAVNAAGTKVILTYNEALNAITADPSNFTVVAGGVENSVTTAVVVGSTLELTLTTVVQAQTVVTVSYAAPPSNISASNVAIQDAVGNDSLSLATTNVTNGSTQDQTPPSLNSASVGTSGTSLSLFYNESLNTTNKPAASAYVVTSNGTPVTVTSVDVNGSTVTLNLGSTINGGRDMTVTYTAPTPDTATSNSAIQDTTGNDALAIANTFTVTNNSTQGPPAFVSGTVRSNGTEVTMFFSKGLNFGSNDSRTVFANGIPSKCSSIGWAGTNTWLLSGCAPTIPAGATVTASWVGPTPSDPLLPESFTGKPLTNLSTVDLTPPTSTALTNPADGTTLTLAFNEALLTTVTRYPTANQFTVTTDGYPTTVSSVSVSGSNLVLTLSSPVGINSTTSVTYTAPTTTDSTTNNAAIQDATGNDTLTFTRALSPNSSTVYQGPRLVSSAVDSTGLSAVLTFSEALNAKTALASSFAMTVNGTPVTITGASTSGSTVTLTTSPAIEGNDVVRVGYTAPTILQDATNDAVQATNGMDAPSFALRTVTQNSSTLDTKGPSLTTPVPVISSTGLKMTLKFNEAVVGSGTSPSAFAVTVDGSPVVPTGIAFVGDTVELTFSAAIGAGRLVTVAYNAPTDNTAIKDTTGNNAQSFTAQAVTNGSTLDNSGPVLSLIARPTVAASGTVLTLTYNESLAAAIATGADFTVMNGTTPVTITGITRPTATTIQLALGSTVKIGQTVTVAYTAPTADAATTNSAVQDTTGNDALSFSAQAVTNLSNEGVGFSSVVIGTNGAGVTLYYNKSAQSQPDFSSLQWFVDGEPVTLTSTGYGSNNGIVTYNFSPTIYRNSVVTMSYTAPNNDLQTVTSVTNFPVTNNSTVEPERIAPVISSAIVNTAGTTLTLNYNEALNTKTALPANFEITINGQVFNPAGVTVSGSSVALAVGRTITNTDVVTVTYNAPTPSTTSNFAIQDVVGNDAAAFLNRSVTNGSTAGPDLTGPVPSTLTVNGTQVTMTMNEFLSSTSAGTDRYTVFVGNNAVVPTAVSISGQNVVLTLPSAVPTGAIVSVSYTAPAVNAGTSNAALQDVLGNDAASFNLTNQPTNSNWEWVGGTPTQTCPGSGSAYPNSSKSKLLPNGVIYTVAVTGDYLCIDRATESLSARGGQAGDFQSVGLVTEPGLMMWTSNNGCIATELIGRCDNRGVMTISFSKPVTNPVISFAGWGGGSNGAGWSEMQLLGGMNGSTPVAGAKFTALAGTNIQVSQNGTVVGNVNGTVPAIYCHRTSGYGANSQAVCGSLQMDGVYTSISMQVNFEYAASSTGSDGGNEDAWNLTASIPEDFGMVPTSYDNPVASHAIGSLKLGSALTADNPSSLYSTTNADAVAAGTEIKAGAKNISNGDVVLDDGVPQASWSGLVDNRAGQTFTIPVTLAGVTETANLCAWIDFNRDRVFTAGERSCATSPAVGATSASISWTIPNDIVAGATYARVRLSYDSLPLPSGKVGSGEVEDYSLVIASSAIPSANKDDSIGAKDVNQTISPLTNDQFQPGYANDMTKMFLCLPNQSPMNCSIGSGQSLTIPGEGTYTLNADGTVTFDPVATFVGTATPIKYQIADTNGRTSSSTINPVVIPAPVGVPNTSSGEYDKDQIITPLANDVPGSPNYPLVSNTLKLCQVDDPATSPTNEAQSPNNCSATSVTIPGEGTYTLNSNGTVTFNPLPTFFGTVATPVKYQAQDSLGQFENSTITPTVAQPPVATATNDISSGAYDTNQVIQILQNDSSDGNEQTLKPETVKLCNPASTPPQTSPNCTLTSLTTADGTYTVNSDGTVTFNPLPTFTGTVATPVVYQVTDALNRKVSANITPTVATPPAPAASADTTTGLLDVNQSIIVTANDAAGTGSQLVPASVVLTCGSLTSPDCVKNANGSVTMKDQGTYSASAANGTVVFDPLPTFTGAARPVTYTVKDLSNQSATSTYTPTVVAPPVVRPDTTTAGWDVTQSINVVTDVAGVDTTNDGVASSDSVDPLTTFKANSTTIGCGTVASPDCTQTVVDGVVTAVTMTGQGTYTVNPATNVVTFNPLDTFAGTARPVTYTISDTLNQTASTTYTPTVTPPPAPTAANDTSTGAYDQNQVISPLTNDPRGDTKLPLLPETLKLCQVDNPATTDVNEAQSPNNCTATSVTIPNEGTYTVNPDGTVTFNPLPSFTGTAQTPVKYQVADALGRVVNATITPSVTPPPAPTASPDTTSGLQDVNQSIIVTANDTAGTGSQLVPASVYLDCGLLTSPDCVKNANGSVTMKDQGTYSANASNGTVVFDPEPSYTGTARPVTYTVKDLTNQSATSTYTPTVIPAPVAVNDTSIGNKDVNQVIAVLGNDTVPSGSNTSFVASTLKLCDPTTNPAQVAPGCTLTTLTTADGSYTVNPTTGTVTFDPNPTFVGTVTVPVKYQVSDNGSTVQTVTATITPTVVDKPVVRPDTTSADWDVTQSINVVTDAAGSGTTNDAIASSDSVDPLTTLKANSLTIACGTATDCTQTVDGTGVVTAVTMTGQGTYTVDPATNIITFNPVDTFTGTARPVTYTISDARNQTASTTYTPTVNNPPVPTALPDVTSGIKGAVQTVNLLTNPDGTDAAGISGVTLKADSVKLCDPNPTAEVSPACTKTSVTVAGVGTYSVNSSGVMTFTPDANYTGTPAPLAYTVLDSTGQKADSTYTPTVIAPPVVRPDTTSAGWDVTQSINVVTDAAGSGTTNDAVASSDSVDPLTTFKANSITIDCASAIDCTETVDGNGVVTAVTMTGQGTYTVNTSTNVITFNPVDTFTGTARPVTYTISDNRNQTASTTYTPTVNVPPAPTATPDTVELIPGQSKVFSSIFDGQTGDTDPALATKGTGAPDLTNASVCLLTPGTTTCDADGIVTIPGEGTYTLNPTTGIVTYAALSTATPGAKTPVTYKITDGLNRSVTSTLTPTITPPPVANPDFSSGVQGAIQNLVLQTNDAHGGQASTSLVPGGIFLCDANQPPPDCAATTVTVPGQGVYTVETLNGLVLIKFTPEPNFTGVATAIGYQIPDNLGQKAYSTLQVTVVAPPAPSAVIDTGSAEYNKPVTLKPWINDAAGSVPTGSTVPAPSLIATSIKLCGDNSTFIAMSTTPADCAATKVKTVEGTYEVSPTTGEVVFTPNPNMIDPITGLPTGKGFVGTVKYPPTYQIWNNYSGAGGVKSATALLVPTIAPPGAPAATVDITKTKPGTSVVLNPVSNDKPGTAALDPTTIRLCGTGEISPACTQMSVTTLDGLYVVDPTTGQVTFTPRDGFTGQATIPYIIKDGLGMMANANLIITVEDTAVVPVAKKTKVGLAKTGGARPDLLLLLGLVAIAGAGGLRVLSRRS